MSLPKLRGQVDEADGLQENTMELLAGVPEWLVWCAAGAAGAFALVVVVNTIEAALDLEAS